MRRQQGQWPGRLNEAREPLGLLEDASGADGVRGWAMTGEGQASQAVETECEWK